MRTIVVLVIVLGATAPLHAESHKAQVRYVGIHPIPKSEGGGICYIQGPHVHTYAADKLQYRVHDGANFFVGDPVAYGYEGPRYAYKGNHPIRVGAVLDDDDDPEVEYCYLEGPHYHAFAPVEGPQWKLVGGAYFYVGAPSQPYLAARPTMLRINAVYQPLVYARPTITVEAPVGWIGARAELAIRAPVVRRPRVDYDYDIAVPEIYVVDSEPVYYYEPVIVEEHWKVKHHHGHWH
jgi:hypothetical protein